MIRIIMFYIVILFSWSAKAQSQGIPDKVKVAIDSSAYKVSYKKLIIPAVMISYGTLSLTSDAFKNINTHTRHEVREHFIAGAIIDNYMQYVPAVAVYGLNIAGIKGKHNFKDRTIIYATSQLITSAIVLPTKRIIGEERPDGTNNYSFPSGHTATAFSSAHFMFREYKDTNFWLSISGYPIAAATGIYRVLNDKHWVGDVVAGAGVGILSTEIAYWLFPTMSKWFSPNDNKSSMVIMPFYQSKQIGLTILKTF